MQWIISAVGLMILVFLAFSTRQPARKEMRNAPLDEALEGYLQTLAARPLLSTPQRISPPRRFLSRLENLLNMLNELPAKELLPASKRLSDHGRMLQEETAALLQQLRFIRALPAAERDETRISSFAREFFSHTNGEMNLGRFSAVVAAWQAQSPFTVREIDALEPALRLALLTLLVDLTEQCVREQQVIQAAMTAADALHNGKEKTAQRIYQKHRHNPLFLTRFNGQVRKGHGGETAFRSQQFFIEQAFSGEELISEERLHQIETVRWVSNAISSLQFLKQMPWHRLKEEWSHPHLTLEQDDAYPRMDAESRAAYRMRIGELSRLSHRTERAVCEKALSLCHGYDPGDVRSHVGYYLLDDGVPTLLSALHIRPSLSIWFRFALGGSKAWRIISWASFALLTLIIVLSGTHPLLWLPLAVLLTFAVLQALQLLFTRLALPRIVPRMQLEHIPDSARTLVVCPTMLLSPEHAIQTVKQLSVLCHANPDPNLDFLLLGDYQDSLTGTLSDDDDVVSAAATAVRALSEDTGRSFLYFQRERIYQLSDHMYMSRERKRGGLETLMKLMEGQPVDDRFTYASIQPERLRGQYRYLLTLDSDTLMPPGTALRLVGAMLHPLQRRHSLGGRMRGVSIIQPRMKTALHRVESWFSLLTGGEGGTDPYNPLLGDFDQDILRNGTFQGKGIIDPRAYLTATSRQMIPGAVLSHDLLEGQLTGCANAGDITLYEGQPNTLHEYLYRLHRWTRGDWQLLPYLISFLPKHTQPEKNTLTSSDQQKLWFSIGRTILRPLQLLLAFLCVLVAAPIPLALVLLVLDWPLLLKKSWTGAVSFLLRILILPLEAGMQADAIARTLYRVLISRRKLLEWTTAAQLAHLEQKPDMLFFYLSMISSGVLALLCLIPGAMRLPGIILAALWAAFPFLLPLAEQPLRPKKHPTGYMHEVLERLAGNTLTFFETAITDADNALPPDHVQIDPNKGIMHRTSPTNIGLYLCSLVAAEMLQLLPPDEMAHRISCTVSTLEKLPKWNGHLYNWYDTRTLQPLKPFFVSTVDSGNLAVCLTTAAQGVRSLLGALSQRHHSLSARLDALAEGMHFAPLYDADAELFHVGIHTEKGELTEAHYDLIASESRLTSFYAIMTGQVPLRHWFHLGRTRVHTPHGQTLLSGNGTLFEYLMPFLFQPPTSRTLLCETARNALQLQRRYQLNGVSGVSESGYYAFDPNLYYLYKAFGLAPLAINPQVESDVIAPYATILAFSLDEKGAMSNLLKMQSMGMEGPLGLFEAADFSVERIGDGQPFRVIHSHMAHHQGMILCAIVNFLCDNALARAFSELPAAKAYQYLLEEPMSRQRGVVRHPLRREIHTEAQPDMYASHPAKSLVFPMQAHVLYGAGTRLLVDALGGGSLSRNGVMMTRFHHSCHLPSGPRLYLKDSQNGAYWMVTEAGAQVTFETTQAIFTHTRQEIYSALRTYVDPLTGAAVHCLTLENRSKGQRMLEVCSYLEPALASQQDMETCPAFETLSLKTARLSPYGVEATRMQASETDETRKLWHVLCTDTSISVFHVQTDRAAFLGRGRSIYTPRELEMPLSGLADAVGTMLDPCLSLRAQFVLQPGGKARFVFVTLMPKPQDTPGAFLLRCDHPESVLSSYESALTQGIVTMRTLDLTPEEQGLLPQLLGLLAYTGQPSQTRYAGENHLPLHALQEIGIIGDWPIAVMECDEKSCLPHARTMLKIHALCRMSGLWFDLVFLCRNETTSALHTALEEAVQQSHSHDLQSQPGGVHLFDHDGISDEHVYLLRACARVVLRMQDGSIADCLNAMQCAAHSRQVYRQKATAAWKLMLPDIGELLCYNGYGGFVPSDGNYAITLPPGRQTPAPWCNPLCSETFGTLASESGLLFSYAKPNRTGRFTSWTNDTVNPQGEENFFLRDEAHKLLWSLTRQPLGMGLAVRITHAPGETVYESSGYGIYSRMLCFTDDQNAMGIRVIQLRNEDMSERILTFCHTLILTPDAHPAAPQLTRTSRIPGGICLENPQREGVFGLCSIDPEASIAATMSAGTYQGLWSIAPAALSGAEMPSSDSGNAVMLCSTIQLKPGESRTLTCVVGYAKKRSELVKTFQALRSDGASMRLHRVKQVWEQRLSAMRFDLPDDGLSLFMNRWLPYQIRASMMMQGVLDHSSRAFRPENLQSLVHTEPWIVRAQLILYAVCSIEGVDEPYLSDELGTRNQPDDQNDPLWLPYMTAVYVEATGDSAILQECISGLQNKTQPETQSLLECCLEMIRHVELGSHGLLLKKNAGGEQTGGESIWRSMFLCEVLRRFAPLCQPAQAQQLYTMRQQLLQRLDQYAWDGGWYLGGWRQDGGKLGSSQCSECRIDVQPQTWAVLSGVSRDRCVTAMENVWRLLYQRSTGILQRFTPPFDQTESPDGAVYPPGVKGNGGQDTQAATGAIAAFHQLGQDERAWELALALLPFRHTATQQLARRYRAEPYVLAGTICANAQQRGRGGWTWYSGSAGRYFTVMMEQLLGLQKIGNTLRFRPVLPQGWDDVHLSYRYFSATYHLHATRECTAAVADGEPLTDGTLRLEDDGRIHEATFPAR